LVSWNSKTAVLIPSAILLIQMSNSRIAKMSNSQSDIV
jgi:hypothetical protein